MATLGDLKSRGNRNWSPHHLIVLLWNLILQDGGWRSDFFRYAIPLTSTDLLQENIRILIMHRTDLNRNVILLLDLKVKAWHLMVEAWHRGQTLHLVACAASLDRVQVVPVGHDLAGARSRVSAVHQRRLWEVVVCGYAVGPLEHAGWNVIVLVQIEG